MSKNSIELRKNMSIETQVAPEVSTNSKLRLLALDYEGAYFQESESNKFWYFSNTERSWRPLESTDVSKYRLQDFRRLVGNEYEFTDIEQAIVFCLSLHLKERIKLTVGLFDDWHPETREDERGLYDVAAELEKIEEVLKLLGELEVSTDETEKTVLRLKIKNLFAEIPKNILTQDE